MATQSNSLAETAREACPAISLVASVRAGKLAVHPFRMRTKAAHFGGQQLAGAVNFAVARFPVCFGRWPAKAPSRVATSISHSSASASRSRVSPLLALPVGHGPRPTVPTDDDDLHSCMLAGFTPRKWPLAQDGNRHQASTCAGSLYQYASNAQNWPVRSPFKHLLTRCLLCLQNYFGSKPRVRISSAAIWSAKQRTTAQHLRVLHWFALRI